MNQQKLHSSSPRSKRLLRTAILIVTAAMLSMTSLVPTASAATIDCSDVFTPLSQFVQDGVTANKSFYVRAMNETGVPWELLAAIHYRETSFSHTNPSNGQGIFQFVNGDGGPYTPGPVSDDNFYVQLKYMATRIQTDYALRNASPSAAVTPRALTASEQDINLIKNTLFSYNGRSSLYAQQASRYGYDPGTQPYEGSPYVMNRFDCPRARMGIITRDYGTIDSVDTRYGAFTIFARLRGDSYWLAMTVPYSWLLDQEVVYYDPERTRPADLSMLLPGTTYYAEIKARNIGSSTWSSSGSNPVRIGTWNPTDRTSPFCDTTTWISCTRPTGLKEDSVTPGNIGTFQFSMKAPGALGPYKEYFNLVAEGKSWMSDIGMYLPLTTTPSTFKWSLVSQDIYDTAKGNSLNITLLSPNTTYNVVLKARNTGNTVWKNSGPGVVNLGTSSPNDRTSVFCDVSWISCNRPATLKESSVAPGETGTFEFAIKTPGTFGDFKEYFRPVAEGVSWLNDIGMHLPFGIKPATYNWSWESQSIYTDSSKSTLITNGTVSNNRSVFAVLKARNTGNTVWKNSGPGVVNLGTSSPNDRTSVFCDVSWISCNRPATLKESSVAPGETGTFEFFLKAPYAVDGTVFKEYFRPVAEGISWLNDVGMHWQLKMDSADYAWQYTSQTASSTNSFSDSISTASLQRSTVYYLRLSVRNIGGSVWKNSGPGVVNLGTSSPNDRTSVFCDVSWISCNRPATLKESSVAPGETGTFEFAIKTPGTTGTYNEYFNAVSEGNSWLNDLGIYWPLIVK